MPYLVTLADACLGNVLDPGCGAYRVVEEGSTAHRLTDEVENAQAGISVVIVALKGGPQIGLQYCREGIISASSFTAYRVRN